MKKVIMTMLTAFIVSAATAQITKGAWLIGSSSSLGYNRYSYKGGSDESRFNISAKGGYFVVKNLVLGLDLSLLSLSQSGYSATVTAVGGFTRYYLPKNIYLGAGVSSTSTAYSGSFSSSTNSTAIPLELGIAAFITRNIAIEPSVNYIIGDNKGVKSTIGLNIGFTIYLNRNLPEPKP